MAPQAGAHPSHRVGAIARHDATIRSARSIRRSRYGTARTHPLLPAPRPRRGAAPRLGPHRRRGGAAAPTVTANPALVPFDPIPGKPGTTTVTFNAGGTTGLTACGQDNANLPTFPLGAVDPNTPLVVPFPFIQAGTYTFWVSTDSTCAATGGKLAQATAARVGPTGKAGEDAVQFASPRAASLAQAGATRATSIPSM